MAYDEGLAKRIRDLAVDEPPLTEKKMFGGLGFMLDGNMAVAASSTGGLMVRIDPNDADELTNQVGAERMEMRGRTMNGWLQVDSVALESDEALATWLSVGLEFAATLPAK